MTSSPTTDSVRYLRLCGEVATLPILFGLFDHVLRKHVQTAFLEITSEGLVWLLRSDYLTDDHLKILVSQGVQIEYFAHMTEVVRKQSGIPEFVPGLARA